MKESQHTEWKESWRDEFLKRICGFANAEGGMLVIGRNDNQIADATNVTINSDGLLDLGTFNKSETIGDLTGMAGSAITLGPTSTLTVGTATATTTYAGSIEGGGTLIKQGAGELHLKTGPLNVWTITVSAGTLDISTNANYAVVNANSTTNFYGTHDLSALNVAAGVEVTFGDTPPPFADSPDKLADFGGSDVGSAAGVVPEPGSIGLLLVGALGFLGRRRRS